MTARALLFVVAAACSGVLRWWLADRLRTANGFAWGTIVVNVTGSFALGVLHGTDGWTDTEWLSTVVGVGALGALTTFSTFIKELIDELDARRWRRAASYGVLSIGGSVLAAAGGLGI